MSEYIDSLMKDLEANGIVPPDSVTVQAKNNINDKELSTILDMERVSGTKYSDEQRKILEHHGSACILACAGSGKALANGTGVLTPDGYKSIETLKVGDKVYDNDGNIQFVLGVYPQGKKKVWKVTFFNSEHTIKCCKDHLWTFYDKKINRWRTETTEYIKKSLKPNCKRKKVLIPALKIKDIRDTLVFNPLYIDREIIKDVLKDDVIDNIPDNLEYSTHFANSLLLRSIGKGVKCKKSNTKCYERIIKILEFSGREVVTTDYDDETYMINVYDELENDYIIDIEETDEEAEMTCIKVSGLSELFLTEHCIVTHNTTISTHLIAKRIMTGEIRDVNKLIYTTYSKAGATEMKDRLDKLLKQLGMGNVNVQVRTLHSFFLQIIRLFGVTADIIKAEDRVKFVRQACKDAEYALKDDDLMLIDNLLSYQVNNLLSDKKTVESYVNTLEDLTLEKYSAIRKSYAVQKNNKKVIDYDDMQSLLYLWLVKYAQSSNEIEKKTAQDVRNYCKAMWTNFYIDEAQDVSKIQFAIIRAMTASENDTSKLDRELVFIGDDDQCIMTGTKVKTPDGSKNIEDIKPGDIVLSFDNGKVIENKVVEVLKHTVTNKDFMIRITTKSGKTVECTISHKLLVKIDKDKVKGRIVEYNGSRWVLSNRHSGFNRELNERNINSVGLGYDLPHFGERVRKESDYTVIRASSVEVGMTVGVLDYTGKIIDEEIVKVEEYMFHCDNEAYDLNFNKCHNFFANDVLVHNCIYQWRGGDPSIILSIGPTFNIPTFVLSTNYRCYNSIVDYATTGIKCNNSRYNKGMSAFKQGGTVKILPSTNEDLCSLSILAMNHIKYWISQGHSLSDIAVLSRNNFHLALLSNMLLREGIYCNMTDDMKLTKSYMYRDVKNLIDISETTWKPELTASVLWKLCRYMGIGNSRVIADFQDNCALSLEDTLGWIIKHFIDKSIDFDKKVKVTLQAEQKMQYYVLKLSTDTQDDMKVVYSALKCGDRQEGIKALLYQYLVASSFMYKSKDKNRSVVGLVKYVINLMIKDGVDKMLDFLRVTEQLEAGRMVIPGEKMTLSTIHSAKGREWKDVIMFACDNVSEPSLDDINRMLNDGISMHDIYEKIDEERRLFYVGNTRAKENLLAITYKQPSMFMLESLGAFESDTGKVDNNGIIVNTAVDPNLLNNYNEFVADKIFNEESAFYYDTEEYKA